MKFAKQLSVLIFLYILSTGVLDVFEFPYVGVKVQPPEFVFSFLLLFLLFHRRKLKAWRFTLISLDYALLAYWLAFGLSCLRVQKPGPWLEWLGFGYLLAVYGLISFWLANSAGPAWRLAMRAVITLGLFSAIVGILGWIAFNLGITQADLALYYAHYPYVGDVVRASGLTPEPSMLAILLEMVILFYIPILLAKNRISGIDRLGLLVLFAGLGLTFGKSLFPTLAAVLWLVNNQKNWIRKRVASFLLLGSLTLYLLGIHFILYEASEAGERVGKERFLSDEILLRMGEYVVVPSTYWVLKKSNWKTGLDHFPWGVGSGEHLNYVPILKEQGLFPQHIPAYDPHSTFLGVFAEQGLLPALLLLLLVAAIARGRWKPAGGSPPGESPLRWGLLVFLLISAVEAISMDVLFFRHFWVGMGLLGALWRRQVLRPGAGDPLK